MIKIIRSACAFLLIFALILPLLLSCSNPAKGSNNAPKSPEGSTMQKALNKLSKADSYTVKTVISYSYTFVDDRLTAKATQTEQYSDLQGKNYRHHSTTQVKFQTPGKTTWDVSDYTLTEGYQDGKLYFSSPALSASASMTSDEYKTYLDETLLFDPLVYVDDCKEKSSEKGDDNIQTLTFSGFPYEAISRFMTCTQPYVSSRSEKFSAYDLEATVKIDENGYPQQVDVSGKYKTTDSENTSKPPVVRLQRYFSKIDSTDTEAVNLSSYKTSKYLPALRQALSALNQLKYQESLSFERKMDYSYEENSGSSKKMNKSNTTEGSLTNQDGAFRGQWKTTAGSTYIDYVYNGTSLDTEDFHSVYQGGSYQSKTFNTSEECWDAKAMQFIDQFLISGHFPIQQISSIEAKKASNGGMIYTFLYNATDFKLFDSDATNYSTPSKSTEISVQMKDGKVVSYIYNAYAEVYSYGTEYIYDGTFRITYRY